MRLSLLRIRSFTSALGSDTPIWRQRRRNTPKRPRRWPRPVITPVITSVPGCSPRHRALEILRFLGGLLLLRQLANAFFHVIGEAFGRNLPPVLRFGLSIEPLDKRVGEKAVA
jgi:hypothetical protein